MTVIFEVARQRLDGAGNCWHHPFMRNFATFIFAGIAASTFAQGPVAAPGFQAPKEVAPGVFEIGAIRLDRNTSTVTFPTKVNMTDGLIEYTIVTSKGPTHESLLVSDVSPQNVHMAMLLLGAKGMSIGKNAPPPERIDAEYLAKAPKLEGDQIFITCKWKEPDGKEKSLPLERWLIRRAEVARKKPKEIPAEDGPWLYTGSFLHEGRFNADVQGVFGAVVTSPGALINNPRQGANDDHMWFAKTDAMPEPGTPVEVSIKLEPAKNKETQPKK